MELRYTVSNGLTLCPSCHRKEETKLTKERNSMNTEVKINEKSYQAAPLRLKQLRTISEMIGAGLPTPKSAYEDISRWLPFVLQCLQVNHPEVTADTLDEMTPQEFTEAWQAIVANSKVKVVSGETKPAPNGVLSTEGSLPPSAGPTVQ